MRELLQLADDDAKARWEALTLGYTESAGTPVLREEIARCCVLLSPTGASHAYADRCADPPRAVRRRYYGGRVAAENVLCCVPQEGVLLAHALLKPGQHVVVTAPGYQSLYGIAKAMGCARILLRSSIQTQR